MRAGILLAAGASRRFGPRDKLLEPLNGMPLICHAAARLVAAQVDLRLAVVSSEDVARVLPFPALRIDAGQGQAESLVAALRSLPDAVEEVLVLLGDMPFLHDDDVRTVLNGAGPRIAAGAGHLSPPAVFPKSWFPRILALTGDEGAGRLLRDRPEAHRPLPATALRDIDRPEDLP